MDEDNQNEKRPLKYKHILTEEKWDLWKEQLLGNIAKYRHSHRWISTGVRPNFVEMPRDEPATLVNGVAPRHPLNYGIEGLRGQLVMHVRPQFVPGRREGLVYDAMTEKDQNSTDRLYGKYVDSVRQEEREHESQIGEVTNEMRITIGPRIWEMMELTDDFGGKCQRLEIYDIFNAAFRCATAAGAHSVYTEFMKLMELKMTDDNWKYFFKEYRACAARITGNGLTAETNLECFFDCNFILKCRGSKYLDEAVKTETERDEWRHMRDLIPLWTKRIMTREMIDKQDKKDGAISANIASVDKAGGSSIEAFSAVTDNYAKEDLLYAWMAKAMKHITCYNCLRKGHVYSNCPDPKAICAKCGNPHNTKVHDTVVEEMKRREARGKSGKQAVRSGSAAEGAAKRTAAGADGVKMKSYAAAISGQVNEDFEDMMRYHEAEQNILMETEVESYAAALNKAR